jgi:hypothetical protein
MGSSTVAGGQSPLIEMVVQLSPATGQLQRQAVGPLAIQTQLSPGGVLVGIRQAAGGVGVGIQAGCGGLPKTPRQAKSAQSMRPSQLLSTPSSQTSICPGLRSWLGLPGKIKSSQVLQDSRNCGGLERQVSWQSV